RPELAAVIGAERFVREIRTIAALQHPHILGLIDSGEAQGTAWFVMPFVEGESLRDRLSREKQLPVGDAIRLATEIASALDYAHRHGVIHRDIKPENILIHDGSALVADFGIALAVSSAGGTRMTETGMSLGTPHYMSPEQAMGQREITARSDVYALGCVTYEMLVGEPPFTGPTAQAIVAKVMTADPASITGQRRSVPPHVESAVLTALEKLPADRFATAAEFAAALAGTGGGTGPRAPAAPRRGARASRLAGAGWVVAAAALALAAWGWARSGSRRPGASFGRSLQVTSDPGLEIHPAISPDGRSVAYAAGTSIETRIFIRPVAGGREIPLTDDTTEVQSLPSWSPDGTRVLFLSRGAVFSAPASGGAAHQEIPGDPALPVTSAAWSPDGSTIAYAAGDSIFLRARDGSSRGLAAIREPTQCAWSRDGALLACGSGNANYVALGVQFGNLSPSRIAVCRVSDGRVETITDSTSVNQSPVWSPGAHRLYFISDRDGPRDVYAQDVGADVRAAGPPVRLTVGLGAQSISLSGDGRRLAYNVYRATGNLWSLPLPAANAPPVTESRAVPVTRGDQIVESARLSKDGQWIYYDSNLNGHAELYRVRLSGGEAERLTSDSTDDFQGVPSPDGKEVAFHSWRRGSRDIYVLPLDGRPRQQVTSSPRQEALPDWAPDGSSLTFMDLQGAGGIWIVRRKADGTWGTPERRLATGTSPTWSPDGRWIAFAPAFFATDGGALPALMIAPVDSGPARTLVDPTKPGVPGAATPMWAADGRTIVFKSWDRHGAASFWSVPVAGGPPRELARIDDPLRPSYRPGWALGRDGIYFTVEDRQSNVWVMETAGL
ncbi:MAG TPA: protein kinase, partial [Gemmatimonadales bacterium]|nr:protein kinase [Gemmatimonadales bacterium]